jgi:6-phosphogluconolactonase
MPYKGQIIIAANAAQLAQKGAELFYKTAQESIERQNRFSVAISGGSTPKAMHRLLSEEPYLSDMPWQQTHFFWVDERMVSVDHPASNYGAAKADLLDKISIPRHQIHPMPGDVPPEEGLAIYQKELEAYFITKENDRLIFDLIFLGIGSDGHTASLFPGDPPADTTAKWVISVKGGNPNVFRMTLTYEVINQARCICFLITGKEKAPVIRKLFENPKAQLPPQKIRPVNGNLIWLLDAAAISLLSKEKLAGYLKTSDR